MKKGYTHISIVLDRSGSMSAIRNDTIGGYNTFLKSQQEAPGEATFSLTQFDTEFTVHHSFVNIQDVPPLNEKTFVPRGGTALYDAIGLTIAGCGEKLAAMDEADRPEKVIMVILTDGEENASKEYRYNRVQEMIKTQQDVFSWEFVFLGANLNAEKVGAGLGIKLGNSMTYATTSGGVSATFGSMSKGMTSYRSMDAVAMASAAFFDEEDRAAQKQEGIK